MTVGTKAWFIKEMTDFLEEKEKNDKFLNDVYEIFGAQMVDVIGQHQYETTVIRLIEDAIGDRNGWVEYFVYECDSKFKNFNRGVKEDGVNVNIVCFAELYDFITSFGRK